MLRFFGRKKEEPKQESVDLPQAILRNKTAIETLEKRQLHLERRIAAQTEEAKARAQANDKRGALFALKRKKMLETELEQLVNAHLSLEQQIMSLESAQTQQVAVGALAAGVSAQKAMNQQLNINKIDDLMEDMQEQAGLQNELAQVLSQGPSLMEDADLLAELHQIEAQQLETALADAAPVPEAAPGTVQAVAAPKPANVVAVPAKPNAAIVATQKPTKQTLSDEEQLQKLWNELA